ncbi:MAG: glycine--tRNA ligase [Acholeplasmatales bacterium]|jgi:glycyl-tRNA synthetase|nr:glycine--tRNA ligase [Acholeplasmatales bacterium]
MYTLEELVLYAKSYGFIYQGSEIYGGLANTYDYGPLGALLKNNIKSAWLKSFYVKENNVLLDSSILLNSLVWKASGHTSNFSDPLTECKSCHQRYRADKLIEEIDKTINVDTLSFKDMDEYLLSHKVKCPSCGESNFDNIKSFNMMFKTYQGVVEESANMIFLRPETAQGIFINFKNIARTSRKKIPFGVCQVGKSFRNEITPGNFIFRTREFEQMELEFFCKPHTEKKWFNYYRNKMCKFLLSLGIKKDNFKIYDHPKEALSHYSNATSDIVFNFPWGFDELWGIASRTDFDLKAHQTLSGEDLSYLDSDDNSKYIPYVVEPSLGVERLLLATLFNGLEDETLPNNDTRTVLHISPVLAPYKVAIFPLNKKEQGAHASKIFKKLSQKYSVLYDETGSIGKRYRRADAIGVPFCVTFDFETKDTSTVTIRYRDTMIQERVKISSLNRIIEKSLITKE